MKTAKTIIRTAIPFLFLTIMTLGLFGVVDIANAANVNCGDTITESTIMDADLVCTGMTGNIVTIGADDVVLDCNGHSITTDTASNAIFAFGTNNAEIKNCSISGSGVGSGIYIDHSTNHSIHNNTFTNLENGITYFRNARNSTIANNTFTDLKSGIYGYCYYAGSYFQDNTQVSGNSFNNISDWAVSLSNKGQFCTVNTDNTFVAPDNSFTNVTNGIMAYGKVVLENLNFTVNGSGLSVGSDAVVRNNIITGTGTGNGISVGAGNLVHDNRFTNFVSGVYLTSNDNEIRDNTFTDMENGIYSYLSESIFHL
jgi:parallel beta-helix repeat protein